MARPDRGGVEPTTLEIWGHYPRACIRPEIGHVRLQQLAADGLRSFYAVLVTSGGRPGRGLAPKTVKNVHGLIHCAPEDAVKQGLGPRNAAALRSARPARVPKVERRVWEPENLPSFLDAVATHRLAVAA